MINAFLQPILERAAQGDQHWHNYFALIAQVNNTPAWGGETMARTFDPVIHRLIRALRKALPDASEEDLYWSYHFLSGALTLSLSQTGRIDRLSNGLCKSSDFESIHRAHGAVHRQRLRAVVQASRRTSRSRGSGFSLTRIAMNWFLEGLTYVLSTVGALLPIVNPLSAVGLVVSITSDLTDAGAHRADPAAPASTCSASSPPSWSRAA